ncbi:MAG: hypothetical protein E7633_09705 [Ruminococcaceae bacterium]|nr:hypothetical protein [Oscillospiraceae bacterium]
MLNNDQLARIYRIKDFYLNEPVFKNHVGYTRVMRQRLNFMRAYINSIGTEFIGPAVTPYNKALLESRPYTARLRLAYAEAAILNNMEPMIHDDELLVGRPDYTPLTEEETKEYKELELAMRGAPNTTYLTLGHMSLDYPKLLRVGINGLIAEVKTHMCALDLNIPENLSKYEFYEGCLMELESELTLQKRYAEKLKEKADSATGDKKAHFEKLYKIVSRVPAEPARSFHEALQAIHFFSFTLWELYYFGRIDQYLYPYYKADIEAGRITPDEALELLCCFLLLPDAYIVPNAAYDSMVGGKDKQGNIVENDITFMALDAAEIVKSGTGKIALAFSKDNSDKLLRRAIQVNATGATQPAIYNDDLITEGLMKIGIAPEDAHYYCNTGCTEITPIGCSGIYPCAPYHNIANALLDAMRENIDAASVKPILDSFEKILHKEIQEQQLHINRRQMERSRNGGEPLRVSCLVDNCLASGRSIDEGGAKYNHIEPTFVGISNVVDSLMVIETLVFNEKKFTMQELLDIIDANYENNEPLRQYIINRIPHYGVDDKDVDKYAAQVSEAIIGACKGITTYRNSFLVPGTFTYIENVTMGLVTQATPDGRLKGAPLAASSSASAGREIKGPTAAILSATSWDHTPYMGGIVVNVKFAPNQMSGDNEDIVLALIRTFIERRGMELQINCISKETLLDAQKNPENYRDLLVRVSGFSAYFTHLHKLVQQEVIDRNEQSFI